jgi:hypothetical protein
MTTTPSPSPQSPSLSLELRDGERIVGWITGDVVRFHGFRSKRQAAQAAVIAHKGMLRRIARGRGRTDSTTETDLGTIRRSTDRRNAPADSRPVASVLSPPTNDLNGSGSGFAFEIRVPPPHDELRMRGIAYVMYRSLRSSGLSWPLVRPEMTHEPSTALLTHAADSISRPISVDTKGGFNVIERLLQWASRTWALPWGHTHRVG